MRAIFILFCITALYGNSSAQPIYGADMENWRSSTSGSSTPFTVMAPYGWYGADSVVIGLGEAFGGLIGVTNDSVWERNLFRESDTVHSGTYSAKVMTVLQDTLLLPGVLTTAVTHVGITIFPTPMITGITFTGGNPVTVKPTSVSAWVKYYPGKDSTGMPGLDSGTLNVQALSHIAGKDSIIGTGSMAIGATSSWVQVTVNVTYPADSTDPIDTMRIAFSSSKPALALDSSTLYVDDVTMTSIDNPIPVDHTGIHEVTGTELVKVYPNPVAGNLYFSSPRGAGFKAVLYSVSGRAVIDQLLTGYDVIDVSQLPSGLYFYTVYDNDGNARQRGKISVAQ